MLTVNEHINAVIDLMIERSRIFSAQDIATYLGWDGVGNYVEEVLAYKCYRNTLLPIVNDGDVVDRQPHYLSADAVRRWWINSTLRWAVTDLTHATSQQLAGALSVAFANQRWQTPPPTLVDAGRQLSFVTEGCIPGTFVFPWVSFFQCLPLAARL